MKSKKKKIKFKDLSFFYSDNSFTPTGTSALLCDSIIKVIKDEKEILDFGCGIGVVGITLFKKKNIKKTLYASDISKESIKLCKLNSLSHRVNVDARVGSLFTPWPNKKFDLIINDISGISEKIANISPWFKKTSCESGIDGTLLTSKVITESKKFLKKKGKIIFPVISLSDSKKILREAKLNFRKVVKLSSQNWPMPKEFYKNKKVLFNLKKNKLIDFEERFGILTFTTDIFLAKNYVK